MLASDRTDFLTLSGLTLDGAGLPIADGRGLLHLSAGRGIRVADCEIIGSGLHGIVLKACEGEVTGNTVTGPAGAGVFSLDARGLRLSGNTIWGAGNNGILVWRSQPGDDGTLVVDNRIEDVSRVTADRVRTATP